MTENKNKKMFGGRLYETPNKKIVSTNPRTNGTRLSEIYFILNSMKIRDKRPATGGNRKLSAATIAMVIKILGIRISTEMMLINNIPITVTGNGTIANKPKTSKAIQCSFVWICFFTQFLVN